MMWLVSYENSNALLNSYQEPALPVLSWKGWLRDQWRDVRSRDGVANEKKTRLC